MIKKRNPVFIFLFFETFYNISHNYYKFENIENYIIKWINNRVIEKRNLIHFNKSFWQGLNCHQMLYKKYKTCLLQMDYVCYLFTIDAKI